MERNRNVKQLYRRIEKSAWIVSHEKKLYKLAVTVRRPSGYIISVFKYYNGTAFVGLYSKVFSPFTR